MNKLYFVPAALLLVCASAFAIPQTDDETGRDKLDRIEGLSDKIKERKAEKSTKVVDFELLRGFAFGDNKTLSGGNILDSHSLKTRELRFQAMGVDVNFTPEIFLSISLDCVWDRFVADSEHYLYLDSGEVIKSDVIATQQALYPAAGGTFKKLTSQVNTFGLEMPLSFGFRAGEFSISAGAFVGVTLDACTKQKVKYANTKINTREGMKEAANFYFGPCAQILWQEVGVFVKYVPQPFIPEIVDSMLTIGVVVAY